MWNLFGKGSLSNSSWNSSLAYLEENKTFIEVELETKNSGFAAVIVRAGEVGDAENFKNRIIDALRNHNEINVATVKFRDDELGTTWIFVEDQDLSQNLAGIGIIIHVLESNDLYDRLIGAIFPFDWFDSLREKSIRLYWIFQSRLNRFTPFVPVGDSEDRLRDQPLETRMEKAMRKRIPTEKKISEWYPIWGIPQLD